MKNKKELYNEMPSTLQAHYIKRGKPLGQTGEEYFISHTNQRDQDVLDLYKDKTEEEMDNYMTRLSVEYANVAEYLELIDSPYAEEADKIQADMLNFHANFISEEDAKEFPQDAQPVKAVSWHSTR